MSKTEVQKLTLEHGKAKLSNVHSLMACAGHPCSIHNRSDHAMRSFRQHWRADRCIMERICPHGVGHDDPDCIDARKRLGREASGIHGCCGCCGEAERLYSEGMDRDKIYDYIARTIEQEINDRAAAMVAFDE